MTSPCSRVLELEVQGMIVRALKMAGFKVKRSPGTTPGDPDLRAYRDDVKLAIEIKRDKKKKLGLWQARKLQQLRADGYDANVVFGYKDFEVKFGKYL